MAGEVGAGEWAHWGPERWAVAVGAVGAVGAGMRWSPLVANNPKMWQGEVGAEWARWGPETWQGKALKRGGEGWAVWRWGGGGGGRWGRWGRACAGAP